MNKNSEKRKKEIDKRAKAFEDSIEKFQNALKNQNKTSKTENKGITEAIEICKDIKKINNSLKKLLKNNNV